MQVIFKKKSEFPAWVEPMIFLIEAERFITKQLENRELGHRTRFRCDSDFPHTARG